MGYFLNIYKGIKSTKKGLGLTLKHLWAARRTKGNLNVEHPDFFNLKDGHVTLQYPHETISIPDHGRYKLDCEIDDCIVCDKCAKICPVDCIEIEAIKSPELIRTTSDGSPVRLHAAKFDIDMAKCCFCGLCTTVCPTECLTMEGEYDYSVVDVTKLNFAFANLTEKEANEKKELYDQFVLEKEQLKAQKVVTPVADSELTIVNVPKPAFRPKPMISSVPNTDEVEKPKFTPKFKSKISDSEVDNKVEENKIEETIASNEADKPKFAPKLKPTVAKSEENIEPVSNISEETEEPKVEFKPKFVPKLKPKVIEEPVEEPVNEAPKPKFIPKLKPKN